MKDKREAVYTIPLKRVYLGRRTNRAPRAIKLIRRFAARHFGAKKVLIDERVNEIVWSRSIEKPPRRITVKIVKVDDETVKVTLPSGEER